jgi:indolepyruvate ferredoxin oxidoreductase alpha subunit
MYAREMRNKMKQRSKEFLEEADKSELNKIEWRDRSLGIVTCSIAYQYVREV